LVIVTANAIIKIYTIQRFDTAGWATERASSL